MKNKEKKEKNFKSHKALAIGLSFLGLPVLPILMYNLGIKDTEYNFEKACADLAEAKKTENAGSEGESSPEEPAKE